jgi:hypothetical protein
VDEFGRGTEPQDGAAFAGHLLSVLDARGCPSLFATHLHLHLLALPHSLPHTRAMALSATDPTDSGSSAALEPEWTYRLTEGVCADSRALHTARHQGIPQADLREVRRLLDHVVRGRRHNPVARLAVPVVLVGVPPTHPDPEAPPVIAHAPEGCRTDPTAEEPLEPSETPEGAVADPAADRPTPTERAEWRSQFDRSVELVRQACEGHLEDETPVHMGPQATPPVWLISFACLYLLLLPDGTTYLGESDAIAERLKTHRRAKGKAIECAVFPVRGGKSVARRLETQALAALQQAGLSPRNFSDGRHRNFATS